MTPGFEQTTTERLLLRAFRESDLDAVFALHNDPLASRFDPSGPLRSRDAARELLALWLADWSQRGIGYWAVERREAPGVVVGTGGLRHKEVEGRPVLNLAYRLTPSTWGSGYATEVARAALKVAREHLPAVPVVAIIHPDNTPSIRVAERLGLRLERIIPYEGIPSRLYVPG
jgi:RimJ/RimL family protein N-acetyltransferase